MPELYWHEVKKALNLYGCTWIDSANGLLLTKWPSVGSSKLSGVTTSLSFLFYTGGSRKPFTINNKNMPFIHLCCFSLNNAVFSVGLRKAMAAWVHATGKIPHCGTSRVGYYSSPPPHIFSKKIWSLVVDVLEVQVCISHLDITAPWSHDGRGFNLWQTGLLLYTYSVPKASRGLLCSIWNVLFEIVSHSVMEWPPHYQNIHLSNWEDGESLNVKPCAQYQPSNCENLILFPGNCPLWEHIKRNNGSSVLCWIQTVLLATSSLLGKQSIPTLWSTAIRDRKTSWSTKTKEALRSDYSL